MILFINTSLADLTAIKLIEQGRVAQTLEDHRLFKQAEILLPFIDKLLQKGKIKKEQLNALAIVSGPGGFSSLRLGITTANALASTLKIPLIEITADEALTAEDLLKAISSKAKKILQQKNKVFKPVVPQYGQEPNITVKKEWFCP